MSRRSWCCHYADDIAAAATGCRHAATPMICHLIAATYWCHCRYCHMLRHRYAADYCHLSWRWLPYARYARLIISRCRSHYADADAAIDADDAIATPLLPLRWDIFAVEPAFADWCFRWAFAAAFAAFDIFAIDVIFFLFRRWLFITYWCHYATFTPHYYAIGWCWHWHLLLSFQPFHFRHFDAFITSRIIELRWRCYCLLIIISPDYADILITIAFR